MTKEFDHSIKCNATYKIRLAELEEQMAGTQEESDEKIKTLEQSEQLKQAKILEMKQLEMNMRVLNEEYSAKLNQMEDQTQEEKMQCGKYKTRIEELEESEAEAARMTEKHLATISHLEEMQAKTSMAMRQYKDEMEQKEEANLEMEEGKAALQREIVGLEEYLGDKEDKLKQMTKELDCSTECNATYKIRLAELEEQMVDTKEQSDEQIKTLEQSEQLKNAKISEMKQLEINMRVLNEEYSAKLNQMEDQKQEDKMQCGKYRTRIEELEESEAEAARMTEKHLATISHLEEMQAETDLTMKQYMEIVSDLEKRLAVTTGHYNSKVMDMEGLLQVFNEKLDGLEVTKNNANKRIDQLQHEVRNMEDEKTNVAFINEQYLDNIKESEKILLETTNQFSAKISGLEENLRLTINRNCENEGKIEEMTKWQTDAVAAYNKLNVEKTQLEEEMHKDLMIIKKSQEQNNALEEECKVATAKSINYKAKMTGLEENLKLAININRKYEEEVGDLKIEQTKEMMANTKLEAERAQLEDKLCKNAIIIKEGQAKNKAIEEAAKEFKIKHDNFEESKTASSTIINNYSVRIKDLERQHVESTKKAWAAGAAVTAIAILAYFTKQ
jgi:chromosome segregation ATPase